LPSHPGCTATDLKISGLAQALRPGQPHFVCFFPICTKGHITPICLSIGKWTTFKSVFWWALNRKRGMNLKTIAIIGTFLAVILIYGFTSGSRKHVQASISMQALTIEKALTSVSSTDALALSKQTTPENSIFASSMIIFLIIAVIGIVVFRRHAYF
jgi:hypothetical protein